MSQLSFPSFDSALMVRDPQGRYQAATTDQILEAVRQAIEQKMQRGAAFTSPTFVKEYLRTKLAGFEHEVFAVLFLDTKCRLIEYVEMFHGTIDSASVYPPLKMQFCDYIAALQDQEASPRHQRAVERWRKKLANLPPAPSLPRRYEIGDRRFQRWSSKLEADAYTRLSSSARQHGLSLAAVILTVYAATLARWSAQRRFTLNIPRFNRPDWHPDIGNSIPYGKPIAQRCAGCGGDKRQNDGAAGGALIALLLLPLMRRLSHAHQQGTSVI